MDFEHLRHVGLFDLPEQLPVQPPKAADSCRGCDVTVFFRWCQVSVRIFWVKGDAVRKP